MHTWRCRRSNFGICHQTWAFLGYLDKSKNPGFSWLFQHFVLQEQHKPLWQSPWWAFPFPSWWYELTLWCSIKDLVNSQACSSLENGSAEMDLGEMVLFRNMQACRDSLDCIGYRNSRFLCFIIFIWLIWILQNLHWFCMTNPQNFDSYCLIQNKRQLRMGHILNLLESLEGLGESQCAVRSSIRESRGNAVSLPNRNSCAHKGAELLLQQKTGTRWCQ